MPRVLHTDRALSQHIGTKTKFVEDKKLRRRDARLRLIEQFVGDYENTDQDTAEFAAEAYVVIRSILMGRRPVKLGYLTDFKGEEP